MGNPIIDAITKDGIVPTANALFNGLGSLITGVRTAITGTAPITTEERQKILDATTQLEMQAAQAQQELARAQNDLQKIDASSQDPMQRRARPFIIWVSGIGLAVYCIIIPLMQWGAALAGHNVPAPAIAMEPLWACLSAAGILGGYRTYEKSKGVA